jgi:hypothetical protein
MMANRKPKLEETVKQLGGQVKGAENGKVVIIYPESWLDRPKKRKKTK